MKKFVFLLALLLSTSAFAAEKGFLERDLNGAAVQGGAPNGLLSQTLTLNPATIDASGSLWWSLYAPVACKVRLMPTSANGAYPQFTAPAGVTTSRYVNRATPFVNFSGCTGGELQRQ